MIDISKHQLESYFRSHPEYKGFISAEFVDTRGLQLLEASTRVVDVVCDKGLITALLTLDGDGCLVAKPSKLPELSAQTRFVAKLEKLFK